MLEVVGAILLIIIVASAIFAAVWISQGKAAPAPASANAPAGAVGAANAHALGISYHSSNADVNTIMSDMQALLAQMQSAQCQSPAAKQAFDSTKANMLAALQSRGNVSCDDAKSLLASAVQNLPTDQLDSASAQNLKTNLTTLYIHAVNAVCVNNQVDATKLGELLDNIHSAIC